MEASWPIGQGLKVSTPRSGVQIPDNAISIEEVWVSIPGEGELCRKLEKILTRDLQHGARSTVKNGTHRATRSDAVRRESSQGR